MLILSPYFTKGGYLIEHGAQQLGKSARLAGQQALESYIHLPSTNIAEVYYHTWICKFFKKRFVNYLYSGLPHVSLQARRGH